MSMLPPGVYREEITLQNPPELHTGVPVFIGLAESRADYEEAGYIPYNEPVRLTLWGQFEVAFKSPTSGFLADAVKGFFQNGGTLCYVVRLYESQNTTEAVNALTAALGSIEALTDADLVCAPDIMLPLMRLYQIYEKERNEANLLLGKTDWLTTIFLLQRRLIEHCDLLGTRFAILDSLPCQNPNDALLCASDADVIEQKNSLPLSPNAALYFSWLRLADGHFVPPCGHVAGIYARVDQRVGVHKAPANEQLEGIVDFGWVLNDAQNGQLNEQHINCLRMFPGRGARVWGARTLSNNTNWIYVNVRRLFITAGRWIDLNMMHIAFEPNQPSLWAQIERDLNTYFTSLFQRGALKGTTPQQAFYVRCNAETNPPEIRDEGKLVAEIGLAPTVPNEFVKVRITRNATGAQIEL